MHLRLWSVLVPCVLFVTVTSAQDSIIEALTPLQEEIKQFILGKKDLVNSLLAPGVDPEKPLSQLYPAIKAAAAGNDSRLRECYSPLIGHDEEFDIFDSTIFYTVEVYYRHFPENFDEATFEQKVKNIIKSLYEIGEHTTACLYKPTSFQLGITQLTDFSDDEYRALLGTPRTELTDKHIESGYIQRPRKPDNEDDEEYVYENNYYYGRHPYENQHYGDHHPPYAGHRRVKRQVEIDKMCFPKNKSAVPNRFDWRNMDVVTPVKYQGSCGSCWAFASIAVLESTYLIKGKSNNKKLDLSEQQLIACAKKDGCNGGTSVDAFNFILENNGVTSENNLRYNHKQNPLRCRQAERRRRRSAKVKDYCLRGVYAKVKGKAEHLNDRDIQQAIREFGTVYATMNADDIGTTKHLKTGIYTNKKCPKVTNHAIVIVGWDKKSWIIKNSWGKKWGDGGFFRMKRGENLCGLNTYITYPIV